MSLFLQSHDVRSQWSAAARGTNINNLKRGDLESTLVPVPPLAEQFRIVAILEGHLSRLDAADRSLESAGRRLQALREQMVLRAVTGESWGKRGPKELASVGTADGALPDLPDGWEWARLGDVAEVVGGVTKDSKRQADPAYVAVPYLRVANVQRGYLDLDSVTTIRVPVAKAEALRLERGDVLLNEGGDRDKLARGWVWSNEIEGCIHQNHVFRARLTESRLTPEFLSFTANSLGGPWAERNGKQSVNLASISLRVIRHMPVVVPAPGLAEQVVSRLEDELTAIDRMVSAIEAARSRSAILRRALLSAAFSGRLNGVGSDA